MEILDKLEKCDLCPRNCKVNRVNKEKGFCGATGIGIKQARIGLHYYEEPCISGRSGSGTIFFSGCNLRCKFCQNYKISWEGKGEEISIEELADKMIWLQEEGANNINLVTGFMYIPQIVEALKIAKSKGLDIPIVYFLLFKYGPMEYIITAFKKYKMNTSVWDMDWAVNKKKETDVFFYFKQAFQDNQFLRALKNTVVLNVLDLIVGFPAPIIFALILNELVFTKFKKVVQTIAYMPHFLSWVIIYSLSLRVFATDDGLLNLLLNNMGFDSVPFLGEDSWWVVTYIFLGVWQNFGWGSIVYLAAIAGINTELYEAASVDGAGRFKKMWHITLPGIKPTIVVLLIMNLGNILGGGFDRPFALQNNLVLNSAEVISTYVYKKGVLSAQYSLTTAVGLFQSVVGVFFLLTANFISRKLGERGIW